MSLEFPDCGSGLAAKQAPLLTARDSIERPEFVNIFHHQERRGPVHDAICPAGGLTREVNQAKVSPLQKVRRVEVR